MPDTPTSYADDMDAAFATMHAAMHPAPTGADDE